MPPVIERSQVSVRRLAIFDLDGTLTRRDTFVQFASGLLLRHPGRWWRLPLLLWPVLLFVLGSLDRGRLKGDVIKTLFRGLSRQQINRWSEQFSANVIERHLYSQARAAFAEHLAAGDEVVLLSASPDLYVPLIGASLGAHLTLCTPILWRQDLLDGRLAGPNHRGAVKTEVVRALKAARPGVPAIAYGNSVSDLDHLRHCEEAVYVNASAGLRKQHAQPYMKWVRWE